MGEVMRIVMRSWYAYVMVGRRYAPTPRDLPEYRTEVPGARRVLLVGNGPTHGWGVITHGLSLTGQMARALQARTGEACDVDYVGDETMNAQTAVAWLGRRRLADYDLIVVVLSMNDAMRLTPLPTWQQSLGRLLDRLRAGKRPAAGLLVVGIQPVASVPGFGGLAGWIGQRHADRLNAAMSGLIEATEGRFMHLSAPVLETGRPLGSPTTYRAWADEIADQAAPLLAREPATGQGPRGHEFAWLGAERVLGPDGAAWRGQLVQLAEEARRAFHVDFAFVALLDGDRQWFPTGAGPVPSSVPRELTYCAVAAEQDAPLVVPNAKKDPRFRDNPYIDITHLPFYAGQALRSRSGDVIGSFCLMAAFPRRASSVSLDDLAEYARRAQDALWRIEDEARTSLTAGSRAASGP